MVVTIQYRVDIFGFLASDSLRSRSADRSTGNWGIQDQRMALRWVHKNIVAFNGDPSKIIIFGESAGAGSVSNHVAMKNSWGLFHGAVSQVRQHPVRSVSCGVVRCCRSALTVGACVCLPLRLSPAASSAGWPSPSTRPSATSPP